LLGEKRGHAPSNQVREREARVGSNHSAQFQVILGQFYAFNLTDLVSILVPVGQEGSSLTKRLLNVVLFTKMGYSLSFAGSANLPKGWLDK
jgi:hypothetical protein